MKIRPLGAILFLADEWTDRHDEANSRFLGILRKCLTKTRKSMTSAGFQPAISAIKWLQTYE